MLTSQSTCKYTLCNVWFIPFSENSLRKSVSTLPIDDIFIGTPGPFPESNLNPVKLPSAISMFSLPL